MKQRTIEKKRAIAGWVFIAPWLCGIVLFFIQPLISLVRYSVTDFQFMQEQGSMFAPLEGGWWENYRTAFQGDALFPQKFTATLLDMLYRVPVILIVSLFVAIVLNQKFKGRGFMRLIFFLPVLVTTGVISSLITPSLTTVVVGGDSATNIFSAALLTRQLLDAGLPEGLVNTVGGMIANVSDLVWSSGVQIDIPAYTFVPVDPSGKGDLNGDGKITNLDVSILLDAVTAGRPLSPDIADMNNDGKVTNVDVSALLDLVTKGS